ncbi:hypothetical protein PHJA_001457700 [Phtheirospermum japonicum]|uniref:Uncharacterized protein n=1 Tax=Phtheirospermum japonicum TaxID=374723 RepID=A0A830C9N6_9LAMI|nr:hypothetical protein PHJA_001457700 [Phtheirospermum japonicum]
MVLSGVQLSEQRMVTVHDFCGTTIVGIRDFGFKMFAKTVVYARYQPWEGETIRDQPWGKSRLGISLGKESSLSSRAANVMGSDGRIRAGRLFSSTHFLVDWI